MCAVFRVSAKGGARALCDHFQFVALFGVMVRRCHALVASLCFVAAFPAPAAGGGGAPVVDVSLASSEAPPALASAIAGFDAGRESLEDAAAAADVRAFNAALQAARPRIDAVAKRAVRAALMAGGGRVASSSSFLAAASGARRGRGGEEVIDVDVAAGQAADASAVVAAARGLEAKWAEAEARDFRAWLADFDALTDVVLQGAGVAVHSLLAGRGQAAASFVEVPVAAVAGPSATAVANMEARRDVGEELGRAKHLTLALALVRRENEMLRAAFRREVVAARSAGASFIGASSADGPGRFTINLQPPREDDADVASAIDGIMLAEREKQRAANAQLAGQKRRALEAGKLELQRSVRGALR